jgi:DNA-binding MarR family transcriptional regulator
MAKRPPHPASLLALEGMLRSARSELGPDITAQRLLILINVYLHEGLSQGELLQLLDSTSISALSRNLAELSDWTPRKTQGPGLIASQHDKLNLRKKRIHLTKKGRRMIECWGSQ